MFCDCINSNVPIAETTADVVIEELCIAPITAESANISEVSSWADVIVDAAISDAVTAFAAIAFAVTESAASFTALIAPLAMESATTAPA